MQPSPGTLALGLLLSLGAPCSGVLAAERHSTVEAQLYFDRLHQVARDDPHAAELVSVLPPVGRAVPPPAPVVSVAVAAPIASIASVSTPPAERPASPQLAAISADSDDLVSAAPAIPAP